MRANLVTCKLFFLFKKFYLQKSLIVRPSTRPFMFNHKFMIHNIILFFRYTFKITIINDRDHYAYTLNFFRFSSHSSLALHKKIMCDNSTNIAMLPQFVFRLFFFSSFVWLTCERWLIGLFRSFHFHHKFFANFFFACHKLSIEMFVNLTVLFTNTFDGWAQKRNKHYFFLFFSLACRKAIKLKTLVKGEQALSEHILTFDFYLMCVCYNINREYL